MVLALWRTPRRAVGQYEQAMALDPDHNKVQYQWINAKAALGKHQYATTCYRASCPMPD